MEAIFLSCSCNSIDKNQFNMFFIYPMKLKSILCCGIITAAGLVPGWGSGQGYLMGDSFIDLPKTYGKSGFEKNKNHFTDDYDPADSLTPGWGSGQGYLTGDNFIDLLKIYEESDLEKNKDRFTDDYDLLMRAFGSLTGDSTNLEETLSGMEDITQVGNFLDVYCKLKMESRRQTDELPFDTKYGDNTIVMGRHRSNHFNPIAFYKTEEITEETPFDTKYGDDTIVMGRHRSNHFNPVAFYTTEKITEETPFDTKYGDDTIVMGRHRSNHFNPIAFYTTEKITEETPFDTKYGDDTIVMGRHRSNHFNPIAFYKTEEITEETPFDTKYGDSTIVMGRHQSNAIQFSNVHAIKYPEAIICY